VTSVRFVLHRPRNAQNIGAAARALANTSAGALWVVEPPGYDRGEAARLAAGADDVLEAMRVVRTLPEALEGCVDVVMTTGKPPADLPPPLDPEATARRLLAAPGPTALVFGDEVRGLPNRVLRKAAAIATIPTGAKSSLNLAQAVVVFGYEILLAGNASAIGAATRDRVPLPSGDAARGGRPAMEDAAPADEALLGRLRERALALLLSAGFLNPQQPDRVLDELFRLLRRAAPSRREVELLLAAADQLARTSKPTA
jgi:tRNA/rRNA methyltransferase/tRNA (cytidine32/uridine32-2'-O)-methyltransferase